MALEDTNVEYNQLAAYVLVQNIPHIMPTPESVYCSCVQFAKWYLGRQNESWGNANQIKPTTDTPYIGGQVLTKEGLYGHLAVITDIRDGKLYLIEANYIPCGRSSRELSLDSSLIRGFR